MGLSFSYNGYLMRKQKLGKPQFYDCQHHCFDRVLFLLMDDNLGGNNTSPSMEYPVWNCLRPCMNYDHSRIEMTYKKGKEDIITETGKWRDEMKFLFRLTLVFR